MAAQVTQYAQVYIRIVGGTKSGGLLIPFIRPAVSRFQTSFLTALLFLARDLKGVEKDGTSDPLVTIAVNGEKTNLETKRVEKTTAPTVRLLPLFLASFAFNRVTLMISNDTIASSGNKNWL